MFPNRSPLTLFWHRAQNRPSRHLAQLQDRGGSLDAIVRKVEIRWLMH